MHLKTEAIMITYDKNASETEMELGLAKEEITKTPYAFNIKHLIDATQYDQQSTIITLTGGAERLINMKFTTLMEKLQ